MDRRRETQLRFLDDCHVTYTLDDRMKPDGQFIYHAALETTKLLFRVSQHDITLLNGLINRIQAGMAPAPIIAEDGSLSPAPVVVKTFQTQEFRLSLDSIQAFLIDDSNNLLMPILEFGVERTVYDMSNWSTKFEFNLGVQLFANYFNIKNSHWEPMIESSQFSVNVRPSFFSNYINASRLGSA
jgi:vacuolar protein sorting-associated protein 13A/C